MRRIRDFGKYLRFVIRSKGLTGLILRTGMLVKRFDIFGHKMKNAVLEM